MSCSYLYGIKKDYIGEDLYYYDNSWLYSPIIWDVLADKYIPELIETPFGFKKSMINNGNELLKPLNNKINDCDSFSDRVCWEMSQQQIFFTKDKKEIASAIRNFVTDNKRYYIDEDDNIGALEREHIIERFNEIANDIENLDEKEYPYFVFKNTSVDDSVESWFDKKMMQIRTDTGLVYKMPFFPWMEVYDVGGKKKSLADYYNKNSCMYKKKL